MSDNTLVAVDTGEIVQIIGPVIDVEFKGGDLPEIYDALEIIKDDGTKVVAEVQQLLGQNTVRSYFTHIVNGFPQNV